MSTGPYVVDSWYADQTKNLDEQAARLRTLDGELRDGAASVAKSVGALGLTAVTAVGLVKIGDFFPFPEWTFGVKVAMAGAALSYATMVGVVVWFSYMLWKVKDPIFLGSRIP